MFLGGALGTLAAAGTASAWALDRFVIDHVEVADVTSYEASQGAGNGSGARVTAATAKGTVSGSAYTSDTTSITVRKVVTGSGPSQLVYSVADIRISDATLLRPARGEQVRHEHRREPATILARTQGVLGINGDYYGFRSDGIVVRNGVLYRDKPVREGLVMLRDGSMRLYDETSTSGPQLVQDGAWQTLSFGPGLVSGHVLFVVADGRSSGYSRGVTMSEFAGLFEGLGATVAYNLDGGGSSAMVFDGKLVNNPLGKGQERETSDVLYIAG